MSSFAKKFKKFHCQKIDNIHTQENQKMYDARTAEILTNTWFFIFFCIRVVQNYTTEREKTAKI
jgi:hypothetical protein